MCGRVCYRLQAGFIASCAFNCIHHRLNLGTFSPVCLSEQVNEAAEIIYDLVDANANLIFGAVVDPALGQEVSDS